MSKTKIGIFDSGLGGLTVLRAVQQHLPEHPIVYLGDTARVPYGTKSRETVIRYALSCAKYLGSYDIGMLVVACNTVSAFALEALRAEARMPVVGVIEPGAKTALSATRTHRVGVLGTYGTVSSKAYEMTVKQLSPNTEVFSVAAPMLVPLVEEGWIDGVVPLEIARTYLKSFAEHDIDTLILGCTHYPVLRMVIEMAAHQVLGDHVNIVDSATATAQALHEALDATDLSIDLVRHEITSASVKLLVTDRPQQFSTVASRFLGYDALNMDVELIDL